MFKSLLTISVISFGWGFLAQFILCGLYVSAVMDPESLSLWGLLALYTASETWVVGVLLHFALAVPIQLFVFGKLQSEDPEVYPLTAVGICVGLAFSAGVWAGDWDWRLFALLVPTAFSFGGMWWNRIGLHRPLGEGTPA